MDPSCIQREEWALHRASAAHVSALANRVPCSINWVSLAVTYTSQAWLQILALILRMLLCVCTHVHACIKVHVHMSVCTWRPEFHSGVLRNHFPSFEEFFFTDPRSHQLTRLMRNSRVPPFSAMVPVLVLGVHRQTSPWPVCWGSKF